MYSKSMKIGLSFEEYRNNDAISQSDLKNIAKCAKYYKFRKENQKDAACLQFGHMLHSYILEPNSFYEQYVVIEKLRRSGAKWEETLKAAGNKEIIFKEDMRKIEDISISLQKNKYFNSLENEKYKEVSFFWKEQETGIACKSRLDGISEDFNIIYDLKTTRNCCEKSFIADFFRLKYHIQAAFYIDAVKEATGVMPDAFIIFSVEKEAPYLNKTYFLNADSKVIECGRTEYKSLLHKYKRHLNDGNFDKGLEESVTKIDLIPSWYDYIGEIKHEG